MVSRYCLMLVVAAVLVAAPAQASAEWFFDLYAGYAWTENSDLTITRINNAGVAIRTELLDVEFDRSPVGGIRAGYWFGFAPFLGLGLDAFYFRPDIPTQRARVKGSFVATTLNHEDVPAAVVGLDLLLRWPLITSPDFPYGRVQPYLTVGPSALISDPDDFGTSVGFKIGSGIAWQVTRHVAVFGEYRFTRYTPEVNSGNLRYEADLNTHHAIGGISFRF